MHTLEVDTEANELRLAVAGDVSAAQLWELRSEVIVASRELDEEFVLRTDVSDCRRLQSTATEHIRQLFTHLESFGLAREVRVVSEETPRRVLETLDRAGEEFTFETETVTEDDRPTGRPEGNANRRNSGVSRGRTVLFFGTPA